MSIQPPYISTQPITQGVSVVIEIINFRPNNAIFIDPPKDPGLMVGYYNGSIDAVELYIVDGSGRRYIKAV